MKQLITLLLLLAAAAALARYSAPGLEAQPRIQYGNFIYQQQEGEPGVTAAQYLGRAERVNIPAVLDGKQVTSVGSHLFQQPNAKGTAIRSVTIPDSVATIEARAFQDCAELRFITVPKSVETIGEDAFAGTAWLAAQTGAVSVNRILIDYKGGDEKIVLADLDVTVVADGAFRGRGDIKEVSTPFYHHVKIGREAFAGCTGLKHLAFSLYAVQIGERAFAGCTGLRAADLSWDVTGGCFDEGAAQIGSGAFSGCTALVEVTLPDGSYTIGEGAFDNCSPMIGIYAPDGSPAADWVERHGFPAQSPARADYPYEEIQAEFLPYSVTQTESYRVGPDQPYWRFTIESDAVTEESAYGNRAWLESAKQAVKDSLLYRSICDENAWIALRYAPLDRWFPDYGDYFDSEGVLQPRFISAITRDFDMDGQKESFINLRLASGGSMNRHTDCVVYVNAWGEASLVTKAADADLSSIVYGEHMTLCCVNGGSGPILTNSHNHYRVRDGKVECVLQQFWGRGSIGDVFQHFGIAQCPFTWLVFWDVNRDCYAQVAAEPVDDATLAALYHSGKEQPFQSEDLTGSMTLTGGSIYTGRFAGPIQGYNYEIQGFRYENGQFVEEFPLGSNQYEPDKYPIPAAAGVNLEEALRRAV